MLPLLRPLGYPDLVLSTIAGSLLALVVYISLTAIGALLFRRTKQTVGMMRLGYGAGGSVIGMLFGFATVWLIVLGIRLLGTVAEAEVQLFSANANKPGTSPDSLVLTLAQIKHSLDQGTTGAVMQRLDPVPQRAYDICGKIARVLSSRESMSRFLAYPGAQQLSSHPRISALQRDPAIVHALEDRNFLGLLSNRSIVAAVNDPEISRLVRNFELEKALDFALARQNALTGR